MRNKNMTYESLIAAVNLLFCDNEQDFIINYRKATHGKGGSHIWWLMTDGIEAHRIQQRLAIRRRREREKKARELSAI